MESLIFASLLYAHFPKICLFYRGFFANLPCGELTLPPARDKMASVIRKG